MIEDFGSYLKSERELRGVPLEEISATTKIHIRFLQALENNQFDNLPGDVFIKGYIRSFAKVIGADESEMLAAYDDTTKKLLFNKEKEIASVESKTLPDKSFTLWPVLIVISMVVVGWGANILTQKSTGSVTQPKSAMLDSEQKTLETIPTKNLSDPASGIEGELPSLSKTVQFSSTLKAKAKSKNQAGKPSNNLSAKSAQAIKNLSEMKAKKNTVLASKINPNTTADTSNNINENSTATSFAMSNTPLKLTIQVKDNVWFNITVDGSRQEDFILPTGATKIFYGKDNFRVTLGNRNVVDLKLNDKTLNLPDGDENNVVRKFIINSQLIE